MIQLSATPPSADSRPLSRAAALGVTAACSALSVTVVLGLATLLGARLRDHGLIADRAAAAPTSLSFTDAPRSAAFFEARDSVTVRVPWDMTLGEFLSLYHLENNAGARAALQRRLGVAASDDVLREGEEVSFGLTARRGARD